MWYHSTFQGNRADQQWPSQYTSIERHSAADIDDIVFHGVHVGTQNRLGTHLADA